MNPEWPWWAVIATLVPAGLGHLCHLVLSVNVVCGLGYDERVVRPLRNVLFSAFWISSGWLLWAHLHSPWWTWPAPFLGYAALCTVSGLVIWPASTMLLALRKAPWGVSGEVRVRDLAAEGGAGAMIGEGSKAWLLRLPGNESFRLHLREWDVPIPGLPGPLDGLRIVQVTDLHFAPCFRPAYFERAIAACREWDADLIVVTGDVVEDDSTIDWIEPLLGPLRARLGKLAILGNHDLDYDPPAIVRALSRAGFETLEGRWTTIEVDGATIAVGGTSAPWFPDVDPAAMPEADFRLLLSHSPDRFYRAARWGIDLMLAGHNHGGQIRLPLVGAVFMPSVYSRRFDRGFFRRGRTLMYASYGIAGVHPVRYGCPPEVTRFTLRPAPVAGQTEGLAIGARRSSARKPERVRGSA